jgi:Tol biopolymer transport system component
VADTRGQAREWSGERANIGWPICLSPEGDRIAYPIVNARGYSEIWVSERGRASAQRIVAVPGIDCVAPAWSPDGKHLAYWAPGPEGSGVYSQPLDGGAHRMISRAESLSHYTTLSWSPDGANIVATRMVAFVNGIDIVRIPARSEGGSLSAPVPLRADPDALERRPSFSPDGRWIAYESNESGREEIYVAQFRRDGPLRTSYMVSSGGGFDPRWGRNGREVFYQSLDAAPNRRVLSVPLRFGQALTAGRPITRWNLDSLGVIQNLGAYFDLLPSGEMVAIQRGEDEVEPTHIEIVVNFSEVLKQKMREAGKR